MFMEKYLSLVEGLSDMSVCEMFNLPGQVKMLTKKTISPESSRRED